MRNPSWSRDEHIIALDFYLQHAPSIPGKTSPEVIALSELLNSLQIRLGGDVHETFRNPAGVYMKLMNFRRFDPAYQGIGLAHGNQDEEVVWNLYANKPAELHDLAKHISSFVLNETKDEIPTSLPLLDEEEVEGNEGQILSRVHRYRERDQSLIKKKKDRFINENGRLFCQCCGFDFSENYGEHGKGFIECHHTKPVSELEAGGATKLSDLVMLCSNCHRMIHRSRPWLSISDLKSKQVPDQSFREPDCIFCQFQLPEHERIVEENALAYATRDAFPVTEHHTLFIPKRHVIDYFGLTQAELNAIHALIHSQKKVLDVLDPTIEGYNLGWNCGEIAGQSVWHCHAHLIPRRKGDVEFPKGGVRHVIPWKGQYEVKE